LYVHTVAALEMHVYEVYRLGSRRTLYICALFVFWRLGCSTVNCVHVFY